jgi:hypothetical protein
MNDQSGRTADAERHLYGAAQHERPADSFKVRYGEPQHESDAESPFSIIEIAADESELDSEGERSPSPDAGRARAYPAGH